MATEEVLAILNATPSLAAVYLLVRVLQAIDRQTQRVKDIEEDLMRLKRVLGGYPHAK